MSQKIVRRPAGRRALVASAVAAVAALAPAAAPAVTPPAQDANLIRASLHVEADRTPLSSGVSYLNGTALLQTDEREACGGSGKAVTLQGPTALGLVDYALRANRKLSPLGVSDKFSFGLFVCGIGEHVGDAERYWLYKVDHVAPEVGADQYRLEQGDEVLWYFVDTARNINTGDELDLVAPARARPGRPFTVQVFAYDAKGRRTPAAGASVYGANVVKTGADGRARITVDRRGGLRLRAQRGADIPSSSVRVCLDRVLSRCPARPGEPIVGTNRGDGIRGTAGGDRIDARGGNDRIDVRGGDQDLVRCGAGRDVVRADRQDRVSKSTCERVLRS